MSERLFSYGTLQQDEVHRSSFGRLLTRWWAGSRRWCRSPEVPAKSGKRHHPIVMPGGPADRVPGMVFEITAEELAAADRYEVADYKRVAAKLASGLTAWVYVKA
ncbi:MAG: gamma-glutamylcyclotransferase [Alphaproteobacteria bacterium]|nr:gamma-glutamylcyclotransferase [Alphaproteobacteria bacterium]